MKEAALSAEKNNVIRRGKQSGSVKREARRVVRLPFLPTREGWGKLIGLASTQGCH